MKCTEYAMTTNGITWEWEKDAAFLLQEGMFVHAFQETTLKIKWVQRQHY